MKLHKRPGTVLDQFFARAAKPSHQQLQLSRQRILQKLMSAPASGADPAEPQVEGRRRFSPMAAALAAAATVLVIAGGATIWNAIWGSAPGRMNHRGMAEAAAGTLYRSSPRNFIAVRPGESIERGEV